MRRVSIWLVVILSVLFTGGCRRAESPSTESPSTASNVPNPRRLVTLAPSLTAMVAALGAADRIVGVSRFDDAEAVSSLPRVGGYTDPSVEAILALRPDRVLCEPSPGNRGAVQALQSAGVAVEVFSLRSIAETDAALRRLGDLLGAGAAAERVIEARRAAERRAADRARRRAAEGRTPPSVAMLYGLNPLVVAGPGTFASELIDLAGGRNAFSEAVVSYPVIPLETFVGRRVDLWLWATMDGTETELAGAGLPLEARQRIHRVRSRGFLQPGPELAQAIDELSDLIETMSTRTRVTSEVVP